MPIDPRSDRLEIRVTPAEKQAIESAATDAGQKISEWVRDIAMAAAMRQRRKAASSLGGLPRSRVGGIV